MKTPGCSNDDRLSNMPKSVINAILMILPIKDAVRTCILSRRWRYKWTAIPELIFDEKCTPPPSNDPHLDYFQRVDIVNRVLLCHKGPISKFQCSKYLQGCTSIDVWITFLSSCGIKEFILHPLEGDSYKVTSHLFSCQDLRHLELTNCIVQPPPTSCCLANLTTLVLCDITITSMALENLLSTCTLLMDLTLTDFEGLTHLKILALNLKKIYIKGSFQGLILRAPLLAFAKFDMLSRIELEEEQMREGFGCNLINVLGPLRYIHMLEVERYFLQFLTVGGVPDMLQTSMYRYLKHLHIDIDFNDLNEISAACFLIAGASYLEDVRIFSDPVEEESDDENFAWEASGCRFYYLNSMKIVGIYGSKNELNFLEFVLANAPGLCTMTIQFTKNAIVEESKIFKSIIQFPRASSQATIIYLDTEEDE